MADTNELLRRADAAKKPSKTDPGVTQNHAPAVRKGEDSMGSRPFSMLKMLGVIGKTVSADDAKVELELLGNFKKALNDTRSMIQGAGANSFFVIGQKSFLPYEMSQHKATQELLEASNAGASNADPDEIEWLKQRINKSYSPQFQKTAMSYLTDSVGGTLVAPPEMGELIPLMRNQSAVDRAGGRMVPLPPQGKWVAPRISSPTTGYWIGENVAITESNVNTGQVEMMAKKLACLVRVPNELFKYASVSADAMLREDIAKTLALGYDFACLYGTSGAQPKGLVFYNGSDEVIDYENTTPTPLGNGATGNTVQPQDGYKMSALVEDRNFQLQGFKWLMRPRMWGTVASFRSSSGAVTTADQLGLFVQDLTRRLGMGVDTNWCGYDVVRSSQIRNTLTKSSGTGLSEVWGGVWSEMLLGLYGAVEFASNPMGEATFIADQTLIRGILHADACPRYPGAFIRYANTLLG
jgi:HK97 family phage major capsid protein